MLCGVISAVAEFMVRVLHWRVVLRFTPLLGLKPGHACDPITCLSGVHSLTGVTMHSATALMTSQHHHASQASTHSLVSRWISEQH
jgi:hypothetical protein